jgi:glutathione peroxidase-family protein
MENVTKVTDSVMDETGEPVYSNLDHELNQEIVTILKNNEGKLYAQHAAWNFCGYIWFKDGKWHEQVLRYHIVVNELSDTDIESLIDEANSLYGYD